MSVKEVALRIARSLGANTVLASSRWRQHRLLILCYHGVSFVDEHRADPSLYVTPQRFRERLTRLRDGGYSVLRLSEALDRVGDGTLPPRSVVITFDDGTRDFAELVVPMLEEFRMPATVYVTTYYCDHPWPVFDTALRYLSWRGCTAGIDAARVVLGTGAPSGQAHDPLAVWNVLHTHARDMNLSAAGKQDLLGLVASAVGVDFDAFLASKMYQAMTPEQIAALPGTLVDVELHTHRHRTPRDRALFMREIVDNRAHLDGYRPHARYEHFCYPSGDYWAEFIDWLRDDGVRSATTCVQGLVARDTNRMLLPRFLDSSLISDVSFDAWTTGVAALIPRRAENRFEPQRLRTAHSLPAGAHADP